MTSAGATGFARSYNPIGSVSSCYLHFLYYFENKEMNPPIFQHRLLASWRNLISIKHREDKLSSCDNYVYARNIFLFTHCASFCVKSVILVKTSTESEEIHLYGCTWMQRFNRVFRTSDVEFARHISGLHQG